MTGREPSICKSTTAKLFSLHSLDWYYLLELAQKKQPFLHDRIIVHVKRPGF